jgi:protein-S-isoprenylcysteine O-methyltransferase Ste14
LRENFCADPGGGVMNAFLVFFGVVLTVHLALLNVAAFRIGKPKKHNIADIFGSACIIFNSVAITALMWGGLAS